MAQSIPVFEGSACAETVVPSIRPDPLHRALLAALDLSQTALFVCDGTARVLQMTGAAERILAQQDGLFLTRDLLSGEEGRGRVSLRRCIALLAGEDSPFLPTLLRVGRTRGLEYELLLYPVAVWPLPRAPALVDREHSNELSFSASERVQRLEERRVLVFVRDPEATETPSLHVLRELYGLTSREGEVLRLLAMGSSPTQIAHLLGVGSETIKTHLKSLYAKTGTTRQAQLVSATWRGLAGLLRDRE